MSTSNETTVTFYYQLLCMGCFKSYYIPTKKSIEDIPEPNREDILSHIAEGKKLLWPLNPPEAEISMLEKQQICPHCQNNGRIRFVWPYGC